MTIIPEDQLRLTQKELDEDLTRYVFVGGRFFAIPFTHSSHATTLQNALKAPIYDVHVSLSAESLQPTIHKWLQTL
jgi:hypothetical protein